MSKTDIRPTGAEGISTPANIQQAEQLGKTPTHFPQLMPSMRSIALLKLFGVPALSFPSSMKPLLQTARVSSAFPISSESGWTSRTKRRKQPRNGPTSPGSRSPEVRHERTLPHSGYLVRRRPARAGRGSPRIHPSHRSHHCSNPRHCPHDRQ